MVIRLEEVSHAFQKEHWILKDLTLDFPDGQLTYILGPSGTGKSVLLKHLLGLLRPLQGRVWVLGEEVYQLSEQPLRNLWKRLGVVFQKSALMDDWTVYENLVFPLQEAALEKKERLSKAFMKVKVLERAEQVGLDPALFNFYPNQLSGGTQRRVAFARAMMLQPALLLCDEPTTGLDPLTCRKVDTLIHSLQKTFHIPVIVVSHDVRSALTYADHLLFLHQGKVLFQGSPALFQASNHEVLKTFLEAVFPPEKV